MGGLKLGPSDVESTMEQGTTKGATDVVYGVMKQKERVVIELYEFDADCGYDPNEHTCEWTTQI